MLSNQLTLTLANGGTPQPVLFDRVQTFNNNRSVYMAPAHTPAVRHMLGVSVTSPKRAGRFLGAMKSMFKVTKDLGVPDANGATFTSPAIGAIDLSIPVGASESSIDNLLDHLAALLIDHRASIKQSLLRSEY